MKRTKLSRKLDRARVSMQKHEVRYIRGLAKRFLKKMDVSTRGDIGWRYVMYSQLSPKQIARICKLLIKLTNKKKPKAK